MKTFESDNCYEILQITPNAGKDEIRHAYRQALALYDEESVATYALFPAEQRQRLLAAIENAYETLIDENRRAAYDRMLIDTGNLNAAAFSNRARRARDARPDVNSTSREENLGRWVAKRAAEPEMRRRIEAILSESRFSGPQLKALREAYGIELSEIYSLTRINRDVMTAIEADRFEDLPAAVYVKQFLKNIAQILQVDPTRVVEGYLEAMGSGHPDR